jgi:hypothetical protein
MTDNERITLVLAHWHLSCAFAVSCVLDVKPSEGRRARLREFLHYIKAENMTEEDE